MKKSQTPGSMRMHVVILGETNAGKSSLFNALTGQDNAVVSPKRGTTTDPVQKAMELIPFGPIVLIDTPGLSDTSELGRQRMQKTAKARRRAEAALYVADATAFDPAPYRIFLEQKLPHLLVFTKCDIAGKGTVEQLHLNYPYALFMAQGDSQGLAELHDKMSKLLTGLQPEERSLAGDLVPPGGTVVLVTPIDSEAPKGRLILPQVQVLRDCLDNGFTCMVTKETELKKAMENLSRADLVITDSQVFSQVDGILAPEIPLTSFSMLLARQRSDFNLLLRGVEGVEALPEGARILMLEGCTHNHTHEDIGRIKIPALLQKRTGKQFQYDVRSGYDFPEDLNGYQLAIQCGGCMLSQRELANRLQLLKDNGIPVTNYGILLAWGAGILERSCRVFGGSSGQ